VILSLDYSKIIGGKYFVLLSIIEFFFYPSCPKVIESTLAILRARSSWISSPLGKGSLRNLSSNIFKVSFDYAIKLILLMNSVIFTEFR